MHWSLRWLVDLLNAIAAWFYRRKFGAAARQLGWAAPEEDGRRGFIIVEIDGLAYDYLYRAMKRGYMPYLTRLILGRKLKLARWRCGLPSTTPASQAGILYGNNWDIPGFRWYDKQTQSSVMCMSPGSVRAIQERISLGRAGLLRGGSSYTNMFDGDARLALFTLAAVGRDRLLENVRGLGFLILFCLSPIRVLKLIGLSLWAWLSLVTKNLATLLRPGVQRLSLLRPVLGMITTVIFRDVTTFSAMVDIYRGMPAIYAGYTGYDEIAHHFGAESREGLRVLHALDKQIRQIDRMRQVYQRREYDLYILSDHGMSPAVPFRHAYGQTLRQFLAAYTGQQVLEDEAGDTTEGLPDTRLYFLLDEIRALESRPHRGLSARLLRAARQRLEEALEARRVEWDLSRRGEIEVRNSGSLSHLYFNVVPRPMDLSEVTLLYPGLLEALVLHPGIGLVVGREGDEVTILGRAGTLWLGPGGRRLEGADPLAGQPDSRWAAEQIARMAQFPHAGDLALLGQWDGERVITFEDQVATHGGLGGPQDWPFLIFPREERLLGQGIENSEELYVRLVQIYGSYD